MTSLDLNQNMALPVNKVDMESRDSLKDTVKLCDFKSFLKMDTSGLDPGKKFALSQKRAEQQRRDLLKANYLEGATQQDLEEVATSLLLQMPKAAVLPQIVVSGSPDENVNALPYSPKAGFNLDHAPSSPSSFGSGSLPLSPIPTIRGQHRQQQLMPRSPVMSTASFQQAYSPCTSESQYSINTGDEEESICLQGDERNLADVAIERSLHEISMRDGSGLKDPGSLDVTLKAERDVSFADDQIVPHSLVNDLHTVVTSSPNHLAGNQQFYSPYTNDLQAIGQPSGNEKSQTSSIGQAVLQELWDVNRHVSGHNEVLQQAVNHGQVETETGDKTLIESEMGGKHVCRICGVEFKLFGDLSIHIQNTHKIPFKCEDCNKEFSTPLKLQKHRKAKHQLRLNPSENKDTVVCPICGVEYSSTYYRRVHQQFHNGIRYACQICGRAFTHPQNMWRHYKLHEGPENYKFACKLCGLPCKTEFTLRRHIDAKHKEVTNSGELEGQTGVIKKENSFSCSVCNKEFSTKQAMYCHLRVHDKNKPVKEYDLSCGVCRKAYKGWGALKKHCNTMHNGMGLVENELKSKRDINYPYVVVQQQQQQQQMQSISAMDVDVVDSLTRNVANEKTVEALPSENSILHEFVRIATAPENDPMMQGHANAKTILENVNTVLTASQAAMPAIPPTQTHLGNNAMESQELPPSTFQTHLLLPNSQSTSAVNALTESDSNTTAHYDIGMSSQLNPLPINTSNLQTDLPRSLQPNIPSNGMASIQSDISKVETFVNNSPILYSALENSNTTTFSSQNMPNENFNVYNQHIDASAKEIQHTTSPAVIQHHTMPDTTIQMNQIADDLLIDHALQGQDATINISTMKKYGRPKGSKNKKRLVKDGKTYFQCEHCDELFLSRPGINNHLKSHKELQNYGKIPTSRMVKKMVKNAKQEHLKRQQQTVQQVPVSQVGAEPMCTEVTEAPKVNVNNPAAGLGDAINQYVQNLTQSEQLQTGNSANMQALLINALNQIVMKQTNSVPETKPSNPLPVHVNQNQMQLNSTVASNEAISPISPIEEAFRIATSVEGQDGQDFLCASTPLSMVNESFDRITVISDEGYNSTEMSDVYENTGSNGANTPEPQNIPDQYGPGYSTSSQMTDSQSVLNRETQAPSYVSGTHMNPVQPNQTSLPESSSVHELNGQQNGQNIMPGKAVKHKCPYCESVFKKTIVLQKHIELHMKKFASESEIQQ